ncbi:MAG: hypothetical protein ACKV2U_22305 [Bryobacteraceae bacterium]
MARRLLSIFFHCCAGWLPAADVAFLRDGDRLTGTIQKLECGTLHFRSRFGDGVLKIDWALVASLATDSDFKVTLRDGSRAGGRVTGLALAQIAALEPVAKPKAGEPPPEESAGWWQNTTLSADFGQSYSGLSGYNQLSQNSEIDYAGSRWDSTFVTHLDYYGASNASAPTYQAYGRLIAHRYIRGDRFFLFHYSFLGRQTKDDGRGQIRQYGGGGGWTFRRHQADQLSLYAGIVRSKGGGFQTETDLPRAEVRVDEPLTIAAISWDKEFESKINVSVKLFYFKPLLEGGHHGMSTDASARIPLFGPAYFTVRAYDTPELGQRRLFSTRNLQVSSGIGIEFK